MIYNTEFSITLKPHGNTPLNIRCGLDSLTHDMVLTETQTITFNKDLANGAYKFILEFYNKSDMDPISLLEIESVNFEGISTDKLKWQSVYYPQYPEPWASQQTQVLPDSHKAMTHLGWNGRWELPFTVPVFRWIHTVENLGWIYD